MTSGGKGRELMGVESILDGGNVTTEVNTDFHFNAAFNDCA